MKRRGSAKGERLRPEYVCEGCGVKRIDMSATVAVGKARVVYCPICKLRTAHLRII